MIWGVPVAVCNIQCSAFCGIRAAHTRVLVISARSSVGLDIKGKAALGFSARWTCETEADTLRLVRVNFEEQVKVILCLRQCRIGNVSAEDPLLPAFIWCLSCTKDIQASQSHPAAQHNCGRAEGSKTSLPLEEKLS